jgi:hypothetical protein
MTNRINTAEGGTNGVLVTGSNSATGGDAFTTLQIDGAGAAGTTLTFSNTQAKHGSLSYHFVTPATTQQVYAGFAVPAQQSALFASAYFYFTTFGGSTPGLFRLLGSATSCSLSLTSAGVPQVFNAVGGSVTTLSSTTIPTGKWIRVEFGVLVTSATVGQVLARFYLTDSESYIADVEYLSPATLNTATNAQSCRYGVSSGAANQDFYMDTLQLSDSGMPGPYAPTDRLVVGQFASLG